MAATVADSEEDGLIDGVEVTVYHTFPGDNDSDRDKLNDGGIATARPDGALRPPPPHALEALTRVPQRLGSPPSPSRGIAERPHLAGRICDGLAYALPRTEALAMKHRVPWRRFGVGGAQGAVAAGLLSGVLSVVGCGGSGTNKTDNQGGAGAATGGSSTVTAGSSTITAGSGGSAPHAGESVGGSAGSVSTAAGAGGGGGAAGPAVPRVENTDGPSVLAEPVTPVSNGKCQGQAVYCSECLTTEGQTAGNCTAVKLGLGQMTSLALTSDTLFYTSANREILKLTLADGKHQSLARGLTFVKSLVVADKTLYFSSRSSEGSGYVARSISVDGGDVTVVSPRQGLSIEAIVPLPDRLLLGVGNSDLDLFTVPKTGGVATSFGGIQQAQTPLLAGMTLYYRANDGMSSTSIDAPMKGHTLNKEYGDSDFILEGDYLYYGSGGAYKRTPTAGGTPEKLQDLATSWVWGRTPSQIIFSQTDAADSTLSHLFVMPIEGGTPKQLATFEYGEVRAVAGNATDLYLGVGSLHGGGLLKIKL